MDHKSAIEFILARMRSELSANLKYHCLEHTLSVMEKAKEIASIYDIQGNELSLLMTAAAYHDSGFLDTYIQHEDISSKIAAKLLPSFGYKAEEIEIIIGMIMSTRIPQTPKTLAEKVLCDADLDYLGGDDYDPVSKSLFEELKLNGLDISSDKWLDVQIKFLYTHHFWTDYSIRKGDAKKSEKLAQLISDQKQKRESS